MSYQDWQPVIFKKSKNVKPLPSATNGTKTNGTIMNVVTGKPAWKVEKMVDNVDNGKPITYVSKVDANNITQLRVKAKLTQKELAQLARLQEKDIKDIESCKAVENKGLLAKVKAILTKRLSTLSTS